MLRISLTKTACLLPLLALCLSGCGLTQRVSEGTKSAFNAVFYKKINTLHLDFTAREALNTDARENHSLSEPVVVRIYQLKDRQTFDRLVYQQLLEEGDILLAADLLASRDVVIGPGGRQSEYAAGSGGDVRGGCRPVPPSGHTKKYLEAGAGA